MIGRKAIKIVGRGREPVTWMGTDLETNERRILVHPQPTAHRTEE